MQSFIIMKAIIDGIVPDHLGEVFRHFSTKESRDLGDSLDTEKVCAGPEGEEATQQQTGQHNLVLAGGVALVKVGAATETEMKEKKHRVEDALQATRAALEEGIVPGGGVALLQASSAVSISTNGASVDGSDDERTGARIVLRALEEPLRQLAENAGLEGSVVVNDVRKAKKGQGLNAATNEIVDLVAEGIIDPAMVTRSALQNAASIAKNILTTEAIVAEVPEKEAVGAGGGMPDMSGMM